MTGIDPARDAAAEAFDALVEGGDRSAGAAGDQFPQLDWTQMFNPEHLVVHPLAGRFLEAGDQISITSAGKAGKSLFILDFAWRAATGRPFLGDQARDPIKILYLDLENNQSKIFGRLISLGATRDDIEQLTEMLDYRPFPAFSGPLNQSPAAAYELLKMVEVSDPAAVILDTASRFINGKENDAETWLGLYRYVHMPLKARGVAGIRLDHFGKDETRGARGSSAKSQDIDHAWEISVTGTEKQADPVRGTSTIVTRMRMDRTHTRSGTGPDDFAIVRVGVKSRNDVWVPGGTTHGLEAGQLGPRDEVPAALRAQVLAQLDAANVPVTAGRDRCAQVVRGAGIKIGDHQLSAVVKDRKTCAAQVPHSSAQAGQTETCAAVPTRSGAQPAQVSGRGTDSSNGEVADDGAAEAKDVPGHTPGCDKRHERHGPNGTQCSRHMAGSR